MSRTAVLALVVALLLLHFALRLHHLPALPLFGDETLLAGRAESIWRGQALWFARESKLLGIWWLALFTPPLNPWLLRAGMLLLTLPGVAALLVLARRLFGFQALLSTGLLLAGAPMLFFFERMALADTSMLTPLAVLLLALERCLARPQRAAAILAGAALAAVVMAKATGLALLPLPALWWLAQDQSRRERRRSLLWLYGTALALWTPLLVLLRLRNIDFLGAAWRIGGGGLDLASLPQRLLANTSFLLRGLVAYHGALPVLVAALLMLVALLIRPRRALLPALACLLSVLAVSLSGGTQLSTRYWLLALPPALLLCSGGLTILRQRLRASAAFLPWLALTLWLVTAALPFMQTAWYAPADLPLIRPGRLEYIEADSAGTMIPELAVLLAQEARQIDGTLAVTGAIAQCNTLELYLRTLPEAEQIALDCPRLMSPEGSGAALDAHVTALARQRAHYLVIFEEAGLVPASDVTSLELVTLAQLPRPGGLVVISVYRPLLP